LRALFLLIAIGCGPKADDGDKRQWPATDTASGPGTSDLGRTPPVLDLAEITTDDGLRRLHGSKSFGNYGVPVSGGYDCDGDGHLDVAMSTLRADRPGVDHAGAIYLSFGDSTISGAVDTAVASDEVLTIIGEQAHEHAGSEIWMSDVTGDGLGDLLIGRQNFSAPGRIGTGALTILVGGPELRNFAATGAELDLGNRPPELSFVDIWGQDAYARLGIWMRAGDVTGDDIADIVVGADEFTNAGDAHAGSMWVIRGGAHLQTGGVADLASFGQTFLRGHAAQVLPPPGSDEYHFGGTVQIADLDGNGRAEVMGSAALNRMGASLVPSGLEESSHGSGGSFRGTMYIAWDDNFPEQDWDSAYTIRLSAPPGTVTQIHGGSGNVSFGEEILGGEDYDGDGRADLFVGDIVGDLSQRGDRYNSGSGHILYDAALVKGLDFRIDDAPDGIFTTTILGASPGDIVSDTALHGDFDGDGISDIGIAAPDAWPDGRLRKSAGILYIFFGQQGRWPAVVDLDHRFMPQADKVRLLEVWGAIGTSGARFTGDMLAYSATAADIDGDGLVDPIVNEMLGDGVAPENSDVGNLIVISGSLVADAELGLR